MIGVRALDADLALVAGAVAAAGGVDRDAVPRRGVEDGDAGRHPHLALRGALGIGVEHREGQLDPTGAVVRGPGPSVRRPSPEVVEVELDARRHAASACGRLRAVRGDPGHAPLVVVQEHVGGLDRLDDLRACGCP